MSDFALAAHKKAWENLVDKAKDDRDAKYGIYASRVLAVKHPEAYLIGDNWFYEGARSLKGFKECYEEPTALGWCHMDYGFKFFDGGPNYAGIPSGHVLSFSDLELGKYRVTDPWRIYPKPYLPVLDQRLGPIALTLKTEGKVVTSLESAVMAYFQAKDKGANPKRLFIVYCDNEQAYLLEEGKLLSVKENTFISRPTGNPILVFNEASVWYPLMDRDDRSKSDALRETVNRFATDVTTISVEGWEQRMIGRLKKVSALEGDVELDLAAIASVRGKGWSGHPYHTVWQSILPDPDVEYSISRHMCAIREFIRYANKVSPATAYLYGVMGTEGSLEERMRSLSREYLINTGMVREAEARGWKPAWRLESWGHLWPCSLMEHTIDDAFRSRTAHCISQAYIIASVLEMAQIPHVMVHFDRGGITKQISHHFALSQDGSFLFDDGIVNFRGIDAPTEDYGPLHSFSVCGEWARPVGDGPYGNVSSERMAELIEQVSEALAERFELRFFVSKKAGSVKATEEERRSVGKEDFLRYLKDQAKDQATEQISLP